MKYRKVPAFSVQVEKEVTKTDKDCNENVVTISYEIKFIGIARLMASSLSNPVDNLSEGIHKIKRKNYEFLKTLK